MSGFTPYAFIRRVDFSHKDYSDFKYIENRYSSEDASSCHGHRTRTYYCGEICMDCGNGYCGCLGSHCCCIEPTFNIVDIPVTKEDGRIIPLQRLTSEQRKELTEAREIYQCGEPNGLCSECAWNIHKGLNGPGLSPNGMRTLMTPRYDAGNIPKEMIIYHRMCDWLLLHPKCMYVSNSFATVSDIYKNEPLRNVDEYIHRQRVEDYQSRVMVCVNGIPSAVALVVALYCSDTYRRSPTIGILPKSRIAVTPRLNVQQSKQSKRARKPKRQQLL